MDIKDYLHLYLGCEMRKDDDSGEFYLTPHTLSQMVLPGTEDCIKNAKPILRKLDSITEREKDELYYLDDHALFESGDGTDYAVPDVFQWLLSKRFDLFQWLLSKRFDLFNLIKSGLAIDKNKTQ